MGTEGKKNTNIAKNHEMNDILNCSVTDDTGMGLGEDDECWLFISISTVKQ